jgi:hypothetical protein
VITFRPDVPFHTKYQISADVLSHNGPCAGPSR